MMDNKEIEQKAKLRPRLIASIEQSADMKQVYITGALGTFTNHDFRMVLLNEKSEVINEPARVNLNRVAEYELIMSHTVVKEIHEWLGKAIGQFEEQVGEIKPVRPKNP
jgi:hypothetical protein